MALASEWTSEWQLVAKGDVGVIHEENLLGLAVFVSFLVGFLLGYVVRGFNG